MAKDVFKIMERKARERTGKINFYGYNPNEPPRSNGLLW